ncbi:MAG: hypothetical protein ACT4OI_02480, partial [Methanobacteriota archaeon]
MTPPSGSALDSNSHADALVVILVVVAVVVLYVAVTTFFVLLSVSFVFDTTIAFENRSGEDLLITPI